LKPKKKEIWAFYLLGNRWNRNEKCGEKKRPSLEGRGHIGGRRKQMKKDKKKKNGGVGSRLF